MNALRDIKTVSEIEVRLQTNEVLVHLPKDTPLGAVSQGIHEAGFKAEKALRLVAEGRWNEDGFLPKGWTQVLAVPKPSDAQDGRWELTFKQDGEDWKFSSASSVDAVPQLVDENDRS